MKIRRSTDALDLPPPNVERMVYGCLLTTLAIATLLITHSPIAVSAVVTPIAFAFGGASSR